MSTETASPRTARSGRNGWRVAGLLATTVALAAGGLVVWRLLAGPEVRHTEAQDQTYRHAISRLEVDLSAGDLTLAVGDPGQVAVRRSLHWTGNRPVFSEQWLGDTLHLTANCPHEQQNCFLDYTVRVPAGVSVRAHTDAGDLTVGAIGGTLDLTTDAGATRLQDTAGPVRARSQAGEIIATGLRSTTVDAVTTAGDVRLRFTEAPALATARTDAGEVEIALPHTGSGVDGYQVQADTEAGSRQVSVGEDSAGRHSIVAHTAAGDVTVHYG